MTHCTRTKQTVWTEDQFTFTSSAGIQNHEKGVSDIVVREVKRVKPDKFGTDPGNMTCVEKNFEFVRTHVSGVGPLCGY